ncbi:MAG: PilT/PilU family type 4a pilus ATPase [Rhodoferax sp.]|nr:PilT/PilU family type 4a pilus ATPase [Rhodoferax sp.]
MLEHKASDLYMIVGAPPSVKVQGSLQALPLPPLIAGSVRSLVKSILSESKMQKFENDLECDLAGILDGLGRFRFNIYWQRGEVAMVVRHVESKIPSIEDLKMPAILKNLILLKRGLLLVVGAAGAGKSTTLAAMLEHRNSTLPGHILTIEDPIEFMFRHKKSIVSQREVGIDTRSFDMALRHALREAPDVIMIGELRDRQTVQHAMNYAETGHLCVSTMHANNANQAIERILNFFPEDAHKRILLDLSLNLQGVIAQRLIPGVNKKQIAASEIMLQSPYIADMIGKGKVDQLRAQISKSNELGMHTFDQSLFQLYASGEITLEQALANAESKTDLSVRIRTELSGARRPAPSTGPKG